jgi:ATP-dependent Zn protease
MTSIFSVLLGWLPLILILLFMYIVMRRNLARSSEMAAVGRQNTEAIKANTEALKAILANLEKQPK